MKQKQHRAAHGCLQVLAAFVVVIFVLTAVPITIAPDEPLAEAARLMLAHKLTALPVTDDDNQLLGIITESDIFGYLIEMQTPPR